PERAGVTGRAGEVVADAFRDLGEVRIPLDDDPLRVYPRAPDVRQQAAQHLGDTTAGGGRVDVQDRATRQPFASGQCRRLEPLSALGPDQRQQPLGCQRGDLDLFEPHAAVTRTRHSATVPPECRRAAVKSPPIVAARYRRFGRPRPPGGSVGRPLPLSVTRTTTSVPAWTVTLTCEAPACCATLDRVSCSTASRCSAVSSGPTVSAGPSMRNSGEKPSSSRAPSTMAKIDTRSPR